MLCFKNADLVKNLSLLDRAFHYGDGCFSTARMHDNTFELKARHFARLAFAAKRLLLNVDLDLIEQSVRRIQQQHNPMNGTLKIMISRGEGNRGYALPDHPADIYVIFYPQTITDFQFETISSGVLNTAMGLSMPQLVGIKSLNRLEQVLLKKEAQDKAWLEALVTDVQGGIVEGVSSNCFIRINNTWITPELRYNGVHGVMRAEILSRMQKQQIVCEQRYVDMGEISTFQSLFFCNALNPMKAVTDLNALPLDVQPCFELFQTLQLNQMSEYA
ncbi:aminodeoxychorismate lyase [Acinetobacter sp. TGL-Y2]|uniref:aminodeoxychorismate lyase n=1 Tax=Acinetobacter sp. TGL-Y2 TaxID=1407071 RepID=UPI0007A68107|nr:aminodeoxychorismate lyase [Acinetobacter sp. TGL-Y2]AMW78451.1 aminodeoxychorismate lyase [Acinetobacter sp. TGL-Y2]